MAAKAIWLSHPLSTETPAYGGARGLTCEVASSIQAGATANTSRWSLPNHLGTHVDAPRHFYDRGMTITDYSSDFWIFNHPQLIEVNGDADTIIEVADLSSAVAPESDLLLIRTGFERFRHEPYYWQSNPGLSPDIARWLRSSRPKVRAVGVDCISITARAHRSIGRDAHQSFLNPEIDGRPVLLIEDMALEAVSGMLSRVIVLPFRVLNCDGTPCTVLGEIA
ncbi:MAG: cyclase family protein [Desulfobacteraceae bacterium]|nr:cyclase family protein [Desulfobacteraceae bacterium]